MLRKSVQTIQSNQKNDSQDVKKFEKKIANADATIGKQIKRQEQITRKLRGRGDAGARATGQLQSLKAQRDKVATSFHQMRFLRLLIVCVRVCARFIAKRRSSRRSVVVGASKVFETIVGAGVDARGALFFVFVGGLMRVCIDRALIVGGRSSTRRHQVV
jgi:hypothetical protein